MKSCMLSPPIDGPLIAEGRGPRDREVLLPYPQKASEQEREREREREVRGATLEPGALAKEKRECSETPGP